MAVTKFTYTDYYSASLSRNDDLQHLLKERTSVIFAVYCAGVTIECMLRAYILKNTSEFDSKHNLERLYEKSKMASVFNENEKEEVLSAIKKANKIRNNNLRYTLEKRMKRLIAHEIVRTNFKDINNYVNKYYSDLFEATDLIITKGQEKWT